jgi:hypothetical protein
MPSIAWFALSSNKSFYTDRQTVIRFFNAFEFEVFVGT